MAPNTLNFNILNVFVEVESNLHTGCFRVHELFDIIAVVALCLEKYRRPNSGNRNVWYGYYMLN